MRDIRSSTGSNAETSKRHRITFDNKFDQKKFDVIKFDENARRRERREKDRQERFTQRLHFEETKEDMKILQEEYKKKYHETMVRIVANQKSKGASIGSPRVAAYNKILKDDYELKSKPSGIEEELRTSMEARLNELRESIMKASDTTLSKKTQILSLLNKQVELAFTQDT